MSDNMGTLTGHRTRAVMAVVALSLMAVVSAVSGLNIALPSLARQTGASQAELTWIVDAYTVVFAGLLLFAGALGDRYGRRLLLAAGLAVFGVSAALAMLVNDPTLLIICRAGMGVGAAAVMPTTLSIITTSFPQTERPRAIGVWVGIAGGGAVLGLFASGLLLEFFSWQSFFALNVTLAAVAFVGTLAVVPNSVDAERPRLDWIGALLSLAAVSAAVFAVIEGPERGWADGVTITALVVGVLAAIAFVAWELRARQPMLDPRLFLERKLSAGALTITVQFFSAFGFFFIVIQYLQFITGRSPFSAAVALLPLPFILLPTARTAPIVAARVGFRRIAPLGLLLMAVGFALLSQLNLDTSYWYFLVGLFFFAAGMGLAGTPSTTAITEALPVSKQGVASALNDTARELGSAFGIAILGSVLNQAYRDGMAPAVAGLPAQIGERILASIAFVSVPEVHQLPGADALIAQAQQSFLNGVTAAVFVGSVILFVAAIVVFALSPIREPAKSDQAVEASAAA